MTRPAISPRPQNRRMRRKLERPARALAPGGPSYGLLQSSRPSMCGLPAPLCVVRCAYTVQMTNDGARGLRVRKPALHYLQRHLITRHLDVLGRSQRRIYTESARAATRCASAERDAKLEDAKKAIPIRRRVQCIPGRALGR